MSDDHGENHKCFFAAFCEDVEEFDRSFCIFLAESVGHFENRRADIFLAECFDILLRCRAIFAITGEFLDFIVECPEIGSDAVEEKLHFPWLYAEISFDDLGFQKLVDLQGSRKCEFFELCILFEFSIERGASVWSFFFVKNSDGRFRDFFQSRCQFFFFFCFRVCQEIFYDNEPFF